MKISIETEKKNVAFLLTGICLNVMVKSAVRVEAFIFLTEEAVSDFSSHSLFDIALNAVLLSSLGRSVNTF